MLDRQAIRQIVSVGTWLAFMISGVVLAMVVGRLLDPPLVVSVLISAAIGFSASSLGLHVAGFN